MPDHDDRLEVMLDEVLLHWEETAGIGPFPVWQRFTIELNAHLDLEEKLLLPLFTQARPADALACAALHAELRAALGRVERDLALKVRGAAALQALKTLLRFHGHRADEKLYPWAVEHLDAASWNTIREAMRALMFNASPNPEDQS
jgi:hypothetical protein